MLGIHHLAEDAPDATLAPQAGEGVEHAYREHGAAVFRVALRMGRGDRAWAEDVTHEVFVDLFDRWSTIDDTARLSTWLYRATVRRCLNRLRRQRLMDRPGVRWLIRGWRGPQPDPERLQLGKEQLDQLLTRLSSLPDKQRVAFCMRHFDDRSGRDIAEIMGHSEGYVSKLLRKAEATLALAMERPEGS
ncbi:MAG: sigma-70 family RNA polymerase sigma factor [Deltaproteobacteria bacterium]|nr:sigma-70 family RNA polymerase sigma factor [Deltaproteobacteria bacterium]